MQKSATRTFAVRLVCPRCEATSWLTLSNRSESFDEIRRQSWEFKCREHGAQRGTPVGSQRPVTRPAHRRLLLQALSRPSSTPSWRRLASHPASTTSTATWSSPRPVRRSTPRVTSRTPTPAPVALARRRSPRSSRRPVARTVAQRCRSPAPASSATRPSRRSRSAAATPLSRAAVRPL